MRDPKEIGLWALYIFPGIIFGTLFVVSVSKLLGVGILPPSMRSGFLYEAGLIFREKPLVIPVLFIIFFGAYLLQGFFTFSGRNRNQAFAGAALGGISISLVILIYTFWKLILSYPIIFIGPFIVVGLLISNYFLSSWRDWLIIRIYKKLGEAEEAVNDFLKIIGEAKESLGDLQLRIFDEIERYKEEIGNIRKRVETGNLKVEEIKSDDLLKKVKWLESISTGESIIGADEKIIKKGISKYINMFEDKEMVDRVLQVRLSEDNLNLKLWNKIRKES